MEKTIGRELNGRSVCAFRARASAPFCPAGSGGWSGAPQKWPSCSGKRFCEGFPRARVGRVVAVLSGEEVSAQMVSRLTRVLDRAVRAFHERRLEDHWLICFWMGCG
jgi:hypothetical protein